MTINAEGQNRTDDTSIFSAVLYQLSYLGVVTTISRSPVVVKTFFLHFITSLSSRSFGIEFTYLMLVTMKVL
jgi:hypothetical protein